MKLISVSWNPPDRQLRQFGFCALVALPLLAWMMLGRTAPSTWESGGWTLFGCFTSAGAIAAVLAVLWPAGLKPIFLVLSLATIPIGMVVGEVLLMTIYFLVFTPVALIFRLIGRDALRRNFDPAATSYWLPKPQAADPLKYYRQS